MSYMPTPVTAEIAGTLRAELARTRRTQAWLGDVMGVTQSQVSKMLLGKVALDLDQLNAACAAFGLVMSDVIRKAEEASAPTPVGTDPRTLIQFLLDHPDQDEVLAGRLAEASQHVGNRTLRSQRLGDEIRQIRSEELMRALASLPPSENRAAGH